MIRQFSILWLAMLFVALPALVGRAADRVAALTDYREKVQPLLETYCYGCHGFGANEGGRTLDEFASDEAILSDTKLWWAVLKNVRSRMMPPAAEPQPTDEERALLFHWIETGAFGLDPANPDPGRVTLRRLNRAEYRNTIRDLIGVDYDTDSNFPPDDTGYGFDTIGDAMSISPMLMEKYIDAAETIVTQAVPQVARVPAVRRVAGETIRSSDGKRTARKLSFYEAADVAGQLKIETAGDYRVVVEARIDGDWEFDPGRAEISCGLDGREIFHQTYSWQDHLTVEHSIQRHFEPGEYELKLTLKPLVPASERHRHLDFLVDSLRIEGPLDPATWVEPPNYTRIFKEGAPPVAGAERDAYAQRLLTQFASRAFRRPVDEASAARLAAIAKGVYDLPGKTFEAGVTQAMIATLASPRFLFHVEAAGPTPTGKTYPLIDEFSLASRLSYFLWTSMPDDRLVELAAQNKLRTNLDGELARMFADRRALAFVSDFVGQWLQARDVQTIDIDPVAAEGHLQEWEALLRSLNAWRDKVAAEQLALDNRHAQERAAAEQQGDAQALESLRAKQSAEVAAADHARDEQRRQTRQQFARFAAIRDSFGGDLRHAMRRETEMVFDYVLRNDRDVAELLDANYTFVNERLANFYGIPNVSGGEMRLVELPPNSPRGGILTQGTMLVVTSNPTRTSPVKRGLFILDNVLGVPAPPPPPAVPPLEVAASGVTEHQASLREALELHRKDPACAGCHARFDPLGLALENFNAMGSWRETEHGRPIDTAGVLLTGEKFQTINELKQVLRTKYKLDFYRCLTEKLLTYAIGRGLEHYDEPTVDNIVAKLAAHEGRFSVLLREIVASAPFQQQRASHSEPPAPTAAAALPDAEPSLTSAAIR